MHVSERDFLLLLLGKKAEKRIGGVGGSFVPSLSLPEFNLVRERERKRERDFRNSESVGARSLAFLTPFVNSGAAKRYRISAGQTQERGLFFLTVSQSVQSPKRRENASNAGERRTTFCAIQQWTRISASVRPPASVVISTCGLC